jgi:hypothetical protein
MRTFDFKIGDVVTLSRSGKDLHAAHSRGENSWAIVVGVNNGCVKLDREIYDKDEYSEEEVSLTSRPLKVGGTYFIVGDYNIEEWLVTELGSIHETPFGPIRFYNGKRSVGGGTLKECDNLDEHTNFVCRGRFFENEAEAHKKMADIYVKHVKEVQRKMEGHKRSMLYHAKKANELARQSQI